MGTNFSEPDVPDAPAIAGLTFRHYRGAGDIAGMLAVHAGCREADRVDPFSVCYRVPNMTPEDYAKDVALLLADGSGRNVLVAEIGGQIAAHSRLEWWREWDSGRNAERTAYLSRGWVLPEWRGKGIGTGLLHWAEERARQINQEAGAGRAELAANASDGEQDAIELLHHAGYELRFLAPELAYTDFDALPPIPILPAFDIRPLEAGQERAVARAIIAANAPANFTAEQLEAWIAHKEAHEKAMVAGCDPAISRIGWHNGEVAGLHVCRRMGRAGDVANVAVLPAYRMKGLARALMFSCLHAMREQGLQGARLYTGIGTERDAPPSGPFRMYHGFGFRPVAFHNRYRKPMPE